MKILLATMSLGLGGAETHIIELALELARRGETVFVASGGGIYEPRLQKAGIVTRNVPLYSKNPILMAKAYGMLSELIKAEKFDIVHAHARIPALICGALQRKYNFRFVTTAHYDFRVTPLLKKLTDWGEHCFAVSPDIADYLVKSYDYPKSNITFVPNGIDTDFFAPEKSDGKIRAEFSIDFSARVILHVSRLQDYSCLCAEKLICAMEKIESPGAVLLIVGGGDVEAKIAALADEMNQKLNRRAVILAGARENVRDFILASDIFVGPSRAALEAMSCGKPTLVSGSQGHIGIFTEALKSLSERTNFCGRGLSLPDENTLADSLLLLLQMTPAALSSLGEYNRRYVSENYSVKKMTDIYLGQYERLAKIKTGGFSDFTVCGYYGFGNTGDESLAGCIIAAIRKKYPSAKICVMSHSPGKTARRFTVSAVPRMNIFAVAKALENTDTFIFGGGNLLQDKTSFQSLLYYTEMLSLAKRRHCRIIVLANGLGPLGKHGKARAAKALMLADSISMREEYSLALCKELVPSSSPTLIFDPAISTKITPCDKIPDGKYFIVAPKYAGKDAENSLCEMINHVSEKYSLIPLLFAMYEKEDLPLCRRLAQKTGAQITLGPEAGELAYLLSGAEFSVCSRLHALVYSTLSACPMLAFSDDEKLISYLDLIGEEKICGFSCAVSPGEAKENLISRACALVSCGAKLRADLSSKLSERIACFESGIEKIL